MEQKQSNQYRVRKAENGIQFFLEEDTNFFLSTKENAAVPDWQIIEVLYSKTKANKAMYRLINSKNDKL